jgi:hypothetical protein
MTIGARQLAVLLSLLAPACSLGGCGTINTKLADGLGDYVPQWAGGLPPDAPPRPGTAKYDEFMRDREKKRLEPAVPPNDPAKSASSGLDPVH